MVLLLVKMKVLGFGLSKFKNGLYLCKLTHLKKLRPFPLESRGNKYTIVNCLFDEEMRDVLMGTGGRTA